MPDKCKSCGANIRWERTVNGKAMPLDDKVEKRLILTTNEKDEPFVCLVDTWQSHFVSCPDAAQHRKPRDHA